MDNEANRYFGANSLDCTLLNGRLYPVESSTIPGTIRRSITGGGRILVWVASLALVIPGACLSTSGQEVDPSKNREVDFDQAIRPILAEKCYQCHGPDAESRKADLRLDTKEGAFGDLGGYFAIKPGDVANSEVVARIFEDDPDSVMPPPDFGKALSIAEKKLIEDWIAWGAPWREHWSFEKLTRPEVPVTGDRNPIDYFIQRKHEELGLWANQKAGRYALARRAALDLIGLPPKPSELRAFLDDKESGAYERYIDRLLASDHFGEHRARFWLDAARYSDTHGLHLDNFREMWLYRDWVIEAYNRNMPFDRFTIEQLAGDLLPSPDKKQLIATGFVRNNASSSEAGSIPEELRVRYMKDRTETVATVFLGLTAKCAACHDHKFDPISQREFYQLGAFFNHSADPPMDGNMRDTYPVVVVPSYDDEFEWNEIQKIQAEITRELRRPDRSAVRNWWESSDRQSLRKEHPVSELGLSVHAPLDDNRDGKTSIFAGGKSWRVDTPGTGPATDHPGGNRGLRFLEKGGIKVSAGSIFQPDQPVTVSMWMRTPEDVKGLLLMSQWGEEDKDKGLKKTGWNIAAIADGAFEMPLRDHHGTYCNTLMPSETPLKPNAWQHVAIRYSGGQAASSISYFIGGEHRIGRRLWDTHLSEQFGKHMTDILTIGPDAVGGGISDLRIFSRWLLDEELVLLAEEFNWKELVERKPSWEELSSGEKSLVEQYHRFNEDRESKRLARLLGETRTRSDYLYARSPTTLVMKEKEGPAKAHILNRGEYDQRGELVSANTPSVLPELKAEGNPNRLDLAEWLVSGSNPLTARVTVNRVWQSLFGIGLVKSSEDFGTMGERPTHPELLDWLASEFHATGWDVKALIRLIVTSSTYQQDSKVHPETRAKDPENRYLARGARRRLDAEVIRDQVLAVSGILNPTLGGPSVKPYQPAGVWKAVAFEVSNTNEFKLDRIENLHRRSIYTFWKRTAIPPAFAAFDAPSREECSVRREQTNTPLQALVLLNDTQHIEAARKLAEQLISKHPDMSANGLAEQAFLRVVGRPPGEVDTNDLVALAGMASYLYQNESEQMAADLISVGKLPRIRSLDPIRVASWTVVINALFNRDDVINQN